jgi:hypothetical protein
MPPWKYRRRLIHFSVFFGAAMIVFAAVTWRSDTQVASQLIIGGVSLISIVVTAYTGFAVWDDRTHFKGGSDESLDEHP